MEEEKGRKANSHDSAYIQSRTRLRPRPTLDHRIFLSGYEASAVNSHSAVATQEQQLAYFRTTYSYPT